MKVLKVADLCQTSSFNIDSLDNELKEIGCNLEWLSFDENNFEISSDNLRNFDVTFLCGQSCVDVNDIVHHRSLDIHYINYLDVIENKNGKLWGDSLFSQSFNQAFLDLRKNRQLSGSVIFLGGAAYLSPIVETLAKYGFQDFSFLCSDKDFKQVENISKQLIAVRLHSVDSTELIQSAKEYSICFVTADQYSESVMADISYFHFLSQSSVVLNMVGRSNFPFQEVSALGTEVIEPGSFHEIRQGFLRKKIIDCAKKLSV